MEFLFACVHSAHARCTFTLLRSTTSVLKNLQVEWPKVSSKKRRAEGARIREKYPDRIPVGAQIENELKEKKLRVQEALNATKAIVEEGIVVGGGCTLLRLASKVDTIKEPLENDEDKVAKRILDENCKTLNYGCNL